MEFSTEEEAREYFGKAYGYNSGFGYVQVNQYDTYTDSIRKRLEYEDLQEDATYVVYAIVNGSNLYVKKTRGTTYHQVDAKVFTLKAAKEKVKYMNKKGVYTWDYARV